MANGRSFQPFIRTFNYTGENISKSNLGTLIGVFEIDEMSEDCAYIVNFLASVAKKEYFSNPRRGAIESFEAALHKINLALSELVKHGNVTWLGRLHGTLGVLEKNNLHFSVTGKAKILLFRNDSISDISDGLASEESHIHPIKTFVEVSSGRLSLDDRVILTSPELLALFSIDELTKNARRMDRDRFMQFLKTALINELDMSGVLLVDVQEETIALSPKAPKNPEVRSMKSVANIFSQSAFSSKKQAGATSIKEALAQTEKEALEKKHEEYVDSKTGHIYVQGATPKEPGQHLRWERLLLSLEEGLDTLRLLVTAQGKWFRKGKKQMSLAAHLLHEESRSIRRKISRTLRRHWRQMTEKSVSSPAADQPVTTMVPRSDAPSPRVPSLPNESGQERGTPQKESVMTDKLPLFMQEKLARFYDREPAPTQENNPPAVSKTGVVVFLTALRNDASSLLVTLRRLARGIGDRYQALALGTRVKRFSTAFWSLFQSGWSYWMHLSPKRRHITLGIVAILGSIAILGLLFPAGPETSPTSQEISQPEKNPTTEPIRDDTRLASGNMTTIIGDTAEPIVASATMNGELYVITKRSVMRMSDRASYPLPSDSAATFVSVMDDLRLIFIYTEKGALYAWSPISKTFVENTLTRNSDTRVTGIGTYLTYLYILDSATDQIYRFPRAEGGFGTGTPWFRETVSIEENSHMAVNETIFVTPDDTTVKGFFRGRSTATLESPEGGLQLTDLYTHPGLTNVYALDSERRRIFVWSQDGRLIKEISHDELGAGRNISVNEEQNEIFIGTDHALLSFKLK